MKKLIMLFLALFFVVQMAFAQDKTSEQLVQGDEVRQAYFDEKVFPKLTLIYTTFNEKLSKADKILINDLRADFENYRSRQRVIRKKEYISFSYATGKQEERAVVQKEMRENEQIRRNIEQKLQPFLDNNKTLINETIAQIEELKRMPTNKQKAHSDQIKKRFVLWDGTKENSFVKPRSN